MTNGDAPITAETGPTPNEAPVQQTAAAMAAPQQAAPVRFAEPAQPALSAAAFELNAAAEAEAMPQPAEVEAPVDAPVDADIDLAKKKEDEEAAQDELVDLAMTPEADVLDAIVAADGAREVSGDEDGASALGGDGSGSGAILGVIALAAVGAGLYFVLDSDDDDVIDLTPPPPPPPPANVAPVITSANAVDVDENGDVADIVLDVDATDADGDTITFSILDTSTDAAAFTIDPATGEVRFVASPDFETQDTFTFTVVATDSEGNATQQDVTVTINDVVEVNLAPTFTSVAAVAIDENSDVATVVLDAEATDPEGDDITFSIRDNNSDGDTTNDDDGDAFTVDPATGEVRFVASPDFETQDTFAFTLVATDSEGNETEQDVTVTINDVDDEAVTVNLDTADNDGNPLTANIIDAANGDFDFTDDDGVASNTIILNFEEGDTITFSEGADLSYSTGTDDPNDLEITVNVNGVVSTIILDDVLADNVGFIFDEATAEAAVGFDFISVEEPAMTMTATADATFA